ncbi:hypothetical protein HK405_008032, partial [Cladochytrium tenue]
MPNVPGPPPPLPPSDAMSAAAAIDAAIAAVDNATRAALGSMAIATALAASDRVLSLHQVLFRRRCAAILQALRTDASSQPPKPPPDPILAVRACRLVLLAASSGWMLGMLDLDALLSDLETDLAYALPPTTPANAAEDERERETATFLIEAMRNNTALLRSSELGTGLDDHRVLDIFHGYKRREDLIIDNDARPLGDGSFGVVRVATYKGRPCAVKIPRSDQAAQESLREAAMLLKLNPSPHIIGVLGLCSIDVDGVPRPATIMKLSFLSLKDRLHASNEAIKSYMQTRLSESQLQQSARQASNEPFDVLMDRLVSSGMLRWTTRVKIARDVILGVAYMHACGIIHGDLKPGNILLDEFDNAKLCDVGASASVNSIDQRGFAFTPGYAPQIAIQRRHATYFNDVFAFGRVIVDIAGVPSGPRLPEAISKVSLACRNEEVTASDAAELILNLFADFDDWDADNLMVPHPPKAPARPAAPPALEPPSYAVGTMSASLAYQPYAETRVLEDPDAAMADVTRRMERVRLMSTRITQARMTDSTIVGHRPVARPRNQLPAIEESGSGHRSGSVDTDPQTVLRDAFPDAFELWRLTQGTDKARFDDLVQMLVIHADQLEAGSVVDVEALRNALDLQRTGSVGAGVFLALLRANGGLQGVVRRFAESGSVSFLRALSGGSGARPSSTLPPPLSQDARRSPLPPPRRDMQVPPPPPRSPHQTQSMPLPQPPPKPVSQPPAPATAYPGPPYQQQQQQYLYQQGYSSGYPGYSTPTGYPQPLPPAAGYNPGQVYNQGYAPAQPLGPTSSPPAYSGVPMTQSRSTG